MYAMCGAHARLHAPLLALTHMLWCNRSTAAANEVLYTLCSAHARTAFGCPIFASRYHGPFSVIPHVEHSAAHEAPDKRACCALARPRCRAVMQPSQPKLRA
jgi:hypothetical protein